MASIIDANLVCMNFDVHLSTLNKNKQRWRSAFATIYCSRALENVLCRKKRKISPVQSDRVVINVVQDYSSFNNVDQSSLSKLVQEKNLNHVNEFGGVPALEACLDPINDDPPPELMITDGIENGGKSQQLVEMTPMFSADVRKRWRDVCIKLRCVIAFSQAGYISATGNQNELLLDNLSQSPPEEEEAVVLYVEPECLFHLARLKDNEQLCQLGGVEGVALLLETEVEKGIKGDDEDIARRCRDFGSNTIQKQSPNTLHFLFETFKDPIVIILLPCAILALGFGVKRHGMSLAGLLDGVSMLVAIFVLITLTTISKVWPNKQLVKLSDVRDNFDIAVIRDEQRQIISVFEAVVGDVVFLKTGDEVPADGLYIDGNPLLVNESVVRDQMVSSVEVNDSHNPFLLSGTKVINGSARMLVTAVGINTEWGKKMLSLKSNHSDQSTPLQKRLHELTKLITMIGLLVASVVLVILLIRYFIGNFHDDSGNSDFVAGKTRAHKVRDDIIGILATPVAIAATAIPEGLLLAVLISTAFSTKRMKTQKAQVRNLSACEAMGTTTVICTEVRGNLTLNHMTVTEFCFGDDTGPSSCIPQNVLIKLLRQGVFWTHTEVSSVSPSDSHDSQIENAIREWVPDVDLDNSLDAEAIMLMCSHYYDENGDVKDMPNNFRENQEQIIQEMKSKGLRCIALAQKNTSVEESGDEDGNFEPMLEEERLIFIGIVGLKYPCLPEAREAVEDCRKAGVDVKIVTRDDLLTARAAAIDCGILEVNGEVVEGPEFTSYAENERLEKCRNIRVMARASNKDKLHIVQCLKEKGEVVAVTGDSIGDAIVLRKADLGLTFETQGTQQAKANSDVIITDNDFGSVNRVLRWGRGMHHKIRQYAQFQLTVSISSLVSDFAMSVSAREPPTFKIVAAISAGKVPYATLQVLWMKLIVGILAVVAITIEEPAEELRQLPPVKRNQPFITNTMWRNIVGQAVYPIVILLTIQFKGESTFHLDSKTKETMIFNIFVLWQLFVICNPQQIEKNIFKGLKRRKFLLGVAVVIIIFQVLIVELLNKFADTKRLNWKQWMACFGFAIVAWPIGWLIDKIGWLIDKIKCSSEAFLQLSE